LSETSKGLLGPQTKFWDKDEDTTILRNVGEDLPFETEQHPRRLNTAFIKTSGKTRNVFFLVYWLTIDHEIFLHHPLQFSFRKYFDNRCTARISSKHSQIMPITITRGSNTLNLSGPILCLS
jgi:hypothetical protein